MALFIARGERSLGAQAPQGCPSFADDLGTGSLVFWRLVERLVCGPLGLGVQIHAACSACGEKQKFDISIVTGALEGPYPH